MTPINFPSLKKRVRSRRNALKKRGESISGRCEEAGLSKEFVSGLLRQKKKTHQFLPGYIEKLADALDCDQGYLLSEQRRPRL